MRTRSQASLTALLVLAAQILSISARADYLAIATCTATGDYSIVTSNSLAFARGQAVQRCSGAARSSGITYSCCMLENSHIHHRPNTAFCVAFARSGREARKFVVGHGETETEAREYAAKYCGRLYGGCSIVETACQSGGSD